MKSIGWKPSLPTGRVCTSITENTDTFQSVHDKSINVFYCEEASFHSVRSGQDVAFSAPAIPGGSWN